jgi:hypothetical protein
MAYCNDNTTARNGEDTYPGQGSLISLALGLTAAAAALNTYGGTEQLVFFRESSAGQSDAAYFVGMQLAEIPHLLVSPVIFVAGFSFLTSPIISLMHMWFIVVGVFFACSGAAHLISIVVPLERSLIVTVTYIAVMAELSGATPTLPELRLSLGTVVANVVTSCSFSRWAAEAFYVGIIAPYRRIYDVELAMKALDYTFESAARAPLCLLAIGVALRALALVALCYGNADRRR